MQVFERGFVSKYSSRIICPNAITVRVLQHHKMEGKLENIDYKNAYHEQLTIIKKLSSKQEFLEFELAQLKKLVLGSRHEKFVSPGGPID